MRLNLFMSERQVQVNQQFAIMVQIMEGFNGPASGVTPSNANENVMAPQTKEEAMSMFAKLTGKG